MMLRKVLPVFIMVILFAGVGFAQVEPAQAAEVLTLGSRGTQVSEVQQALNHRGYWCGKADGIFGPQTQKAVIKFQQDQGLPTTGNVAAMTRAALGLNQADKKANNPNNSGKYLTMTATAYTDDPQENWPWGGYPSYIGLPLARGIVAVDPNVIPMGSKLYIEGYGNAIAADQGGAIKGNRIDLFMDSKYEAINWGMRTVQVTILS